MSKMKNCKSCNAEIAASAKTCPHCGAKNKKPLYLRPWFIVLVLLVIVGVVLGGGSEESAPASGDDAASSSEEQVIEYTPYEVDQLMDDLESNAMKAADLYDDQYVELTGKLSVIDSSGSYIDITPIYDEFAIMGVQCYIQNEEQKQAVMDLSIGDTVAVKGKITDVGEIMGYSLDIDSIEVQ